MPSQRLAPAPRAQDPEPARGELQAGQCQPHAGRPARRSPRVLARPPHLHRRLPGRGQVKAVRGESEPRGRDLSAGELRGLFEACARAPREAAHQSGRGRRVSGGTRPSWPSPTAPECAGRKQSRWIWPTSTSPPASCASARARAKGPAWRLWPPRPSPPSRTGCRSGVGSRVPSSAPCSRAGAWSARAREARAG
jgi:hypothetical protein